jgi:hypothetical protein
MSHHSELIRCHDCPREFILSVQLPEGVEADTMFVDYKKAQEFLRVGYEITLTRYTDLDVLRTPMGLHWMALAGLNSHSRVLAPWHPSIAAMTMDRLVRGAFGKGVSIQDRFEKAMAETAAAAALLELRDGVR